jgi:proliferating cell nuclear antigen
MSEIASELHEDIKNIPVTSYDDISLKVKIESIQLYEFIKLIVILKDNLNEIQIDFLQDSKESLTETTNNGGMRITALDKYKNVLVYVKININQFTEFYVKNKIHSVVIDLIQFHRFIESINPYSIMIMTINKDDESNIIFESENIETFKNTAFIEKISNVTYIQKLSDLNGIVQKLPKETIFDMSVTINIIEFQKLCNIMSKISEYVEIICTSKEITFKCQSDSITYVKTFKNSAFGVKILCIKSDAKEFTIVHAIYSINNLIAFSKCDNICTDMQLFLKNDLPLFIHYKIVSPGKYESHCKMLVGISPIDEKIIKADMSLIDETEDTCSKSKKRCHE